MKLLIVVLTVSLISFIETKSVEDNTRKCIVKYLSDKQLLNSSFVVDPMLPDNCGVLIDDKVRSIYEASYYKDLDNHRANYEFGESLNRADMVDLVLKSDFIGDTEKAKNLISDSHELSKIKEFMKLWYPESTKKFNFTSPNAIPKSCRDSYISELLGMKKDSYYSELAIYMFQNCKETITSLKKSFEVEVLEMFPKLSSEKGQICIRKAYTQLNMTNHFFTRYIFKTIDNPSLVNIFLHVSSDNSLTDWNIFSQSVFECVKLITKEPSNNSLFIEVDFNRILDIYSPRKKKRVHRKTDGIIVKLNHEKNGTEIVLLANPTSEVMKYSSCFVEELKRIDFKTIVSKFMLVEEDFDVIKLMNLQDKLKKYVGLSLSFCKPSNFNERTKTNDSYIMSCFSQFVTEEDVEGPTFIKGFIVSQPDDVKCNIFFKREKSFKVCLSSGMKKMNYYIRFMEFQLIRKEMNRFSNELKEKCEKEVFKFEREFKDMLYICMVEDFMKI